MIGVIGYRTGDAHIAVVGTAASSNGCDNRVRSPGDNVGEQQKQAKR